MPNIENKVLGTFTGKCCDYTAVNNNGMYLSQELFENLLVLLKTATTLAS